MDTGSFYIYEIEERLLSQARWLASMVEESERNNQIGMMAIFAQRLEVILKELDDFYELEALRHETVTAKAQR